VKKVGTFCTIGIFLATSAANCAGQSGCVTCVPSVAVPTLPQWCAIIMGLGLIGISIFLMRRSNASELRSSQVVDSDERSNDHRFDPIAR
jgi:hypothetical protein